MKLMKRIQRLVYLLAAVGVSSAVAGAYEDFFAAVKRDDAGATTSLMQRGFDPNSRSLEGQVALFLALRAPSPQVAAALLAHPQIDVNATNGEGETPLMMAALKGNLPVAQRLVALGARPHKDAWSPLHYAATGPEPMIVELLLDKGAPVDALSPNASTPLMMASRYGSEASVQLLLRAGANPKLRNQRDLTAADFARLAGREALAQRLAQVAR